VTVKIDLPASNEGVDLYPDRANPLDQVHYRQRLKRYGIAVRKGDSIVVTKVKVKDKTVEFQLGGGGYGTFWDEKETSSAASRTKSSREQSLESQLRSEKDPRRRRSIESDLRYERTARERRNERAQDHAAVADDARKDRVVAKRLAGGSRFNIRFEQGSESITTDTILKSLAAYLKFESK